MGNDGTAHYGTLLTLPPSVNVTGYMMGHDFSLSILISNVDDNDYYYETIKVVTRHDGIFTLENNYHYHSYYNRYDAAIQQIFVDIIEKNKYHQYHIPLVIKSIGSASCSGGGRRMIGWGGGGGGNK